jgi:hypothetical protein
MTEDELGGMRAALSSFAEASGLRLGKTFVETPKSTPGEFTALVWEASQGGAIAVLARTEHLDPLGGVNGVRAHLEAYTRARVVLVPAEQVSATQTGEVGS